MAAPSQTVPSHVICQAPHVMYQLEHRHLTGAHVITILGVSGVGSNHTQGRCTGLESSTGSFPLYGSATIKIE